MKKFLIILTCVLFFATPAFAEKIPVRIEPSETVSTHHDEIELGDTLKFSIAYDVYVNDKLYLKAGTPVYSMIEFFHQNGWAGDAAEIRLSKFNTTTVDNQKISINYPIIINGNNSKANDTKQFISTLFYPFETLMAFVRGSEICIEPDQKAFNLFIER